MSLLMEPASTSADCCLSTCNRPMHVLLGVSGSVAAVKAPELAVRLVQHARPCRVRILLTKGGSRFWDKARDYNPTAWEELRKEIVKGKVELLDAYKELHEWNTLGDSVLHIDLRNWADMLVIAPLSANTLAKLAHGFCDDTLSCVARAWEFGRKSARPKPMILAPAMNTTMWEHKLTQQQLDTIHTFFQHDVSAVLFQVVEPQLKLLACGEHGNGALAEVSVIVANIFDCAKRLEDAGFTHQTL
ncbi:hypothetical protein MPSEU_000379500 [Mayamaea pseudoterrestris]|nr:hypothetical protein MPSEU_000379500 [Mayamaea pseudoterrestris]